MFCAKANFLSDPNGRVWAIRLFKILRRSRAYFWVVISGVETCQKGEFRKTCLLLPVFMEFFCVLSEEIPRQFCRNVLLTQEAKMTGLLLNGFDFCLHKNNKRIELSFTWILCFWNFKTQSALGRKSINNQPGVRSILLQCHETMSFLCSVIFYSFCFQSATSDQCLDKNKVRAKVIFLQKIQVLCLLAVADKMCASSSQ